MTRSGAATSPDRPDGRPNPSSARAEPDTDVPGARPAGVTLSAAQIAALEAERDFLLTSVRDLDLEHAAGEIAEEQYDALVARYSARAARILRTLDAAEPAALSPAPSKGQRWRRRIAVVVPLLAVLAAGLAQPFQ